MGCGGSNQVAKQVYNKNTIDYHEMFIEADKDRKGTISEEELHQFLQKKGYDVPRDLIHKTVVTFDDNDNGKLDEKEFVELMKRLLTQ